VTTLAAGDSIRNHLWRRFCQHRLAIASLVLLGILAALCAAAPLLVQTATIREVDGVDEVAFGPGLWRYTDTGESIDTGGRFQPSSAHHWLGTDDLGRDLLIRLLEGGRISLTVGLVAALCASLVGVGIGALAGYFGGVLDMLLMRFTDAMLSVPVLALMIVISMVDLTKLGLGWLVRMRWGELDVAGLAKLMFVVVIFQWMGVARLVRGSMLTLKERDFVMAARALGAGHARIIFHHLVPNAMAPIIVATTLAAGSTILYESVLSFLGLGVMPPTSSWGNMLSSAQEYMRKSPWLAVYPGVLIWLTVTAFNFLGDGLRDALDPKHLAADGRA